MELPQSEFLPTKACYHSYSVEQEMARISNTSIAVRAAGIAVP